MQCIAWIFHKEDKSCVGAYTMVGTCLVLYILQVINFKAYHRGHCTRSSSVLSQHFFFPRTYVAILVACHLEQQIQLLMNKILQLLNDPSQQINLLFHHET